MARRARRRRSGGPSYEEVKAQIPLVSVSGVYQWGFSGLNFHWNEVRNYTWNEIPGRLHLVRASELQSLLDIPYAYYLTNL